MLALLGGATIVVVSRLRVKADEQFGLTAVDVKGKGLILQPNRRVGLGGKVHSEIGGCDGLR